MSPLRVPALRSLYAVRFCTGGVFGAMPVATVVLHRRLVISVALFAAGGVPLLAARGILALAALLPLAGLAMAPATVSAMEVMQRVVPLSVLTQTISWDTTSLAFGMTAGSFLAGAAAGLLGIGRVFLVPVCSGVLALIAVLVGGRRIRAACLADAGRPVARVGPGQPEAVR